MAGITKHVAKWNDRKCLVLFREIPGETENALLIMTGELGATQHDELISVVDSQEAQANSDLAQVLNGRNFSDGRIMLQALHADGMITKAPVSEVTMTPTPNDNVALADLNNSIAQIEAGRENDKPNLADTSEIDAVNQVERPRQLSEREADEQMGIAKGLLEQANMIEQDIERVQQQMIADANSKREEAYARAPELKPKPKPGRPKKSAIQKGDMSTRKIILTHNSQLSNFDKLLKDIFTTEIPSNFVDKIVVTDKNGNTGEKKGSSIEGAIPLNPNVDTPLSKLWNQETESVEIFLNIEKVENFVTSETKKLLDKYEE